MTKISDIIQNGNFTYKKEIESREKINESKFMNLLSASIKLGMKYGKCEYNIDNKNRDIIIELFKYLNFDDRFSGDLNKGIILAGAIGSGKTLLMTAFLRIFSRTINDKIRYVHSKDVMKYLDEEYRPPTIPFISSVIYIDDIGKEPSEYKDYGNIIRPFEDFIRRRYENNVLTFGTTNYTLNDLPYITHTKDRMNEMFNFIVLPGKTRRV